MAVHARTAHRAPMVEIILVACTALAFLVLVAAVPIEVGEELSAQHERRIGTHRR